MQKRLLILALLIIVSLPTFFCRNLWNPDEPRYMQVASEMSIRGNYLVPRLNGEIYPEKPPLFFWLIIASKKLFGLKVASRAVSLLAALGVAWLTMVMGRELLGHEESIYGALVLITAGMFAVLAQVGNMDTLLTLWVMLSLFCFLRSENSGKRGLWLLGCYLSMALGTLTKGPVAIAISYLVIVAWLIYKKRARVFREGHLLWGLALALFVVGLWFGPACLKGGREYLEVILKKQVVGRAVDAWGDREPFFYYLIAFPLVFLPWTGLVPAALKRTLKEKGEGKIFLFVWAAVIFVFFSVISSKRERYLLPMFPAASLLVGCHIVRLKNEQRGYVSSFIFFIFAAFSMLALYFLPLEPVMRPIERYFDAQGAYRFLKSANIGATLAISTLAALALSIAGIRGSWRGKPKRATALAAAAVVVFSYFINFTVLKRLDPVKSFRYFTAEVKSHLEPGEDIALWRRWFDGAVNVYLGRASMETLYEEFQLKEFAQMGRSFTIIFAKEDYGELGSFSRERLKVLARGKNGGTDLVFARFSPKEGDIEPEMRKHWLEKGNSRLKTE